MNYTELSWFQSYHKKIKSSDENFVLYVILLLNQTVNIILCYLYVRLLYIYRLFLSGG